MGTAIGVPLWVVLGTGAYFAPVLIEELVKLLPKPNSIAATEVKSDVVDLEAKRKEGVT